MASKTAVDPIAVAEGGALTTTAHTVSTSARFLQRLRRERKAIVGLVLIVALAFVAAVGEPPSEAASAAAIPTLVGEERLGWANGLVSAGRNLGYTLGPVAGGAAAAAFGARWVFAANAVSFVPSALLVAGIPARFSAATSLRSR